jgi:hypothetical protein
MDESSAVLHPFGVSKSNDNSILLSPRHARNVERSDSDIACSKDNNNNVRLLTLSPFLVANILHYLCHRKCLCNLATASKGMRDMLSSDIFKHVWEMTNVNNNSQKAVPSRNNALTRVRVPNYSWQCEENQTNCSAAIRLSGTTRNGPASTSSSLSTWRQGPALFDLNRSVGMCIDDYCPLCPLKKVKGRQSRDSCMRALKCFPLRRLHIHCFVGDIPLLLQTLSVRKSVCELYVKLTNKSNCAPLHQVLMQYPELIAAYEEATQPKEPDQAPQFMQAASSFPQKLKQPSPPSLLPELVSLCLDSSLLQHVNLLGRALLIGLVGKSLISLSLVGHTPYGLFALLAANNNSTCPNLLHLRADNVLSEDDFLCYSSNTLQSLSLFRPTFSLSTLPTLSTRFPSLRYFRYVPSSILGVGQASRSVSNVLSMSKSLQKVYMEVPSSLIEESLTTFGTISSSESEQQQQPQQQQQQSSPPSPPPPQPHTEAAITDNMLPPIACGPENADSIDNSIHSELTVVCESLCSPETPSPFKPQSGSAGRQGSERPRSRSSGSVRQFSDDEYDPVVRDSETLNNLAKSSRQALADHTITHSSVANKQRNRSRSMTSDLTQGNGNNSSVPSTQPVTPVGSPRTMSMDTNESLAGSRSVSLDVNDRPPTFLVQRPTITTNNRPANRLRNTPQDVPIQPVSQLTDLVLVGSINNVGIVPCRAVYALGQCCGQTLQRLSLICSKSIFHLTLLPTAWQLLLCAQKMKLPATGTHGRRSNESSSSSAGATVQYQLVNLFPVLQSLTVMHCGDNRGELSTAMEAMLGPDSTAIKSLELPSNSAKVPLVVTFLECKKSMNLTQWNQLQQIVPEVYGPLHAFNVSVEVKDMIDC